MDTLNATEKLLQPSLTFQEFPKQKMLLTRNQLLIFTPWVEQALQYQWQAAAKFVSWVFENLRYISSFFFSNTLLKQTDWRVKLVSPDDRWNVWALSQMYHYLSDEHVSIINHILLFVHTSSETKLPFYKIFI